MPDWERELLEGDDAKAEDKKTEDKTEANKADEVPGAEKSN